MKISTRLIITEIVATAICMFLIIFYVSNEAKNIQKETAQSNLINQAKHYAAVTDAELEIPMDAARTIAQMLASVDALPPASRREFINSQLKNVLMENPTFAGIWTCWEPNAFDGLDRRYANTEGHDETGRYIPSWTRNGDFIEFDALLDYNVKGLNKGDYYLKVKENEQETVLDPYSYTQNGNNYNIITVAVPIFNAGQFVGAIGIDISTDRLQELVMDVHPYENEGAGGYAFLVANNLTIAAHPSDTIHLKSITRYTTKESAQKYRDSMVANKPFTYERISPKTKEKSLYYAAPIKVGHSNDIWMFVVSVPEETVFASVDVLNSIANIATVFALGILALIAWFSGRTVEQNIQKVRKEISNLIKSGTEGKLANRGESKNVHKDFQPIVSGINSIMDAIIKPLYTTSDYLERISQGDIPEPIEEEYKGDFNTIKQNINQMIDTLNSLTNEMNQLYKEQASGDFEYYMDDTPFKGVYQQVAQGYNQAVKLHVDNILTILDIIGKYGEGDFDAIMPDLPGKQIVATETVNQVRANLLSVIDQMKKMYEVQAAGDYEYFMDIEQFKGSYKDVAESYNMVVQLHVTAILNMLDIIGEYGNGNFDKQMPELPGKQIIATQIINGVRENLLRVVSDINDLTSQVQYGDLNAVADSSNHQGEYATIIEGLNSTLQAITTPLTELVMGLQQLSSDINEGKLSSRLTSEDHNIQEFSIVSKGINDAFNSLITPVNVAESYMTKIANGEMPDLITEEYKGDFNKIKNSINSLLTVNKEIIESAQQIAEGNLSVTIKKRFDGDELMIALQVMVKKLSDIVTLINDAADNVATGSSEISTNASTMAQGAHEQAASVEEVSASIEQMEATVNQNSENAKETEQRAMIASHDVEAGSKSVGTTVDAMRTIIEKIQVVTDIADKTDLLAINAAIEAARAGEHGEGFAVVAGEVRKLAEMSKEAAKEINVVSKNSLNIAEDSGAMLESIVPQIRETVQMVKEIANASDEQNQGIQQITSAISQLNNLSQQNAASAEELSTGSEELNSQADMLRETMSYFSVEGKRNTKTFLPKNIQSEETYRTNNNGIGLNMEEEDDSEYEKY